MRRVGLARVVPARATEAFPPAARGVRIGLALFCALAVSGCGQSDEDGSVMRTATVSDLAIMVVPNGGLTRFADGLNVDDSSGPTSNKKAAEDTLDPRDTARTLTRAGRLEGYELTFSNSTGAAHALATDEGVIAVGTGVELFRDAAAAAAYLEKQADDFERFQGRKVGGGTLAAVEPFDVDVGDEARGVRMTFWSGKIALYATIVAFRRDSIVGGAYVLLSREREISADLEGIALTLNDRVEGVLTGQIREVPAQLAAAANEDALDPKPLTLTGESFPLRTSLIHEGYIDAGPARAYSREYDVLGGRLGRSKIFYLRTVAQVFNTASASAREQDYLVSRKGSTSITRRFLDAYFRRSQFKPGNVEARPLQAPNATTAAFQFFFDAPKGRIEGVLMSVVRGRVRGTVTVMGFEADVEVADVLAISKQVRARLRS
jgi:hypothetical protein